MNPNQSMVSKEKSRDIAALELLKQCSVKASRREDMQTEFRGNLLV